jgi:hypothetical protein
VENPVNYARRVHDVSRFLTAVFSADERVRVVRKLKAF